MSWFTMAYGIGVVATQPLVSLIKTPFVVFRDTEFHSTVAFQINLGESHFFSQAMVSLG
jgi:hypothetical protein